MAVVRRRSCSTGKELFLIQSLFWGVFFLILKQFCNYYVIQMLRIPRSQRPDCSFSPSPKGLTRLYRTLCTSWSPASSKVRAQQRQSLWQPVFTFTLTLQLSPQRFHPESAGSFRPVRRMCHRLCHSEMKQKKIILKRALDFFFLSLQFFCVELFVSRQKRCGCCARIKLST